MVKVTIAKWESSRGIRLTKTMLDTLGVDVGEELQVRISGKKLILIRKKHMSKRAIDLTSV